MCDRAMVKIHCDLDVKFKLNFADRREIFSMILSNIFSFRLSSQT